METEILWYKLHTIPSSGCAVTRQIVCVAGILRGRKGGKKGEGIGKGERGEKGERIGDGEGGEIGRRRERSPAIRTPFCSFLCNNEFCGNNGNNEQLIKVSSKNSQNGGRHRLVCK